MARIKGSDDLFRLIHSLTKEEKGYFQKFAKRHTNAGNIYLKLFNQICQQSEFEEESIKNKFKNFSRTKVYLKEMIAESMLVYHRKNHPHIRILNEAQQAHFLLSKGLYAEALSVVEDALVESEKMELFPITRYLLRMKTELKLHKFSQPEDVMQIHDSYKESVELNLNKDLNLFHLELLNLDWFVQSRTHAVQTPKNSTTDAELMKEFPALSFRAEMKRTEVMNWFRSSHNDREGIYKITKKQVELALNFRDERDSSYYCVVALDNHILICVDLKKFDEALDCCNRLLSSELKLPLYQNIAYVWGTLRKCIVFLLMGDAYEALQLIRENERKLLLILSVKGQAPGERALRAFYIIKLVLLFANKKHKECWIYLNSILSILNHNKTNIPNLEILQLMIQFELGNFELLKNMAGRASKKISKISPQNQVFKMLLDFFAEVTHENSSELLKNLEKALKENEKAKGSASSYCFGIFSYLEWIRTSNYIAVKTQPHPDLIAL
jgi:ribosomal protein S19